MYYSKSVGFKLCNFRLHTLFHFYYYFNFIPIEILKVDSSQ